MRSIFRSVLFAAAVGGCVIPQQPGPQVTPYSQSQYPQQQPTAEEAGDEAAAYADPEEETPPVDPYSAPAADPYPADPPPSAPASSTMAGGRWVSEEWATVTNPAMAGADFYLAIDVDGSGNFRGTWGQYICLTSTYGIISCSLASKSGNGSATGRLAADGTGSISLERAGQSSLTWHAKTESSIVIELPRSWTGDDNILFRSTLKR
jgi:hypothetical protein